MKARAKDLDLLRFFAAVAVMLYHFSYRRLGDVNIPLFPMLEHVTKYGYLGVNLFFMISGFVILWTALDRGPGDFARSRFVRLYPTFWAALFITVIGVLLLSQTQFTAAQIVKNATMVGGYLGTGYIDGVYWTLQLEVKFYVLVFALLLFDQMRRIEAWLIAWFLLAVVAYFFKGIPGIRSLVLYPYGFYFIAGAFFFLVRHRGPTWPRLICLSACFLFTLQQVGEQAAGCLFTAQQIDFVIVRVLCALFFATFAMGCFVDLSSLLPRYVISAAAITYPLYLIHNRLGKLVFAHLSDSIGSVGALFVSIAVVSAIAWAVVLLVDQRLSKRLDAQLKRIPMFRKTANASAVG